MKRLILLLVLVAAAGLAVALLSVPPGHPEPEPTDEKRPADPGPRAGTATTADPTESPPAFPIRLATDGARDAPVDPTPPDALQEIPPGLREDDCGRHVLERPLDPELPIQIGREGPIENPRATFVLEFGDEVNPYGLLSTSLMPGETMDLEALFADESARFEATAEAGTLTRLGPREWSYRAPPAKGHYCIQVTESGSGESICLNVFVMVPYDGQETLNGYRIGRYESVPLRGNSVYQRPRGFIEVTEGNFDTWVSPHFRLSQFVGKQPGGFPKYVLISPRLLLKLEMMLERIRDRGFDIQTLHVMSGFRTPYYNASIGNRTTYSRHTYGDAADVFVDADGDGTMDDLDGDGRITVGDARLLYAMIEEMYGETWYMPFVGGMGLYGPKPHRGPFVHVDTRGFRARW